MCNSCRLIMPFEVADLISMSDGPAVCSRNYRALAPAARSNGASLCCQNVCPRQLYSRRSARVNEGHLLGLCHRLLCAGRWVRTLRGLLQDW